MSVAGDTALQASENNASETSTGGQAIELLVIAPQQDAAETLKSLLRDAGNNVAVTWLDRPEALADQLLQSIPKLVCCQAGSDAPDPARLVGLCRNMARGIPVLAIVSELESEQTTELLNAGASQVFSLAHPGLALRALEQEIELTVLRDTANDHRRKINQLEKRVGIMVAESADALAYVHEGIHTHLNPSYAKIFGFEDPAELEGAPLMDLVAPQSRDEIKKQLTATAKNQAKVEFLPFVAQRADDSNVTLNMRCRPAQIGGEAQIEVVIKHNIAAQRPAPANAFEGRLALYQAISDGGVLPFKQHNVGLLYIRVDELEKLQDRIGLKNADSILHELSVFLMDQANREDRVFRFDVSDFVMLTVAESSSEIEALAQTLRKAIDSEVFGDEAISAPLTVSIAVTPLADPSTNVKQLLKAARLAQRLSVREGNTVFVDTGGGEKQSTREKDRLWLDRIKQSLANDSLALTYQGIASLEGDPAKLYDIFLRMQDTDGEPIRAGEFLPTAQRHGLMPAIDQWVLRKAFASVKQHQQNRNPALMFVKLSLASLEAADAFLPWLKQLIESTRMDHSDLAIAFDEETLQANVKKATALAQALREMGFKLAIHGFGATSKSLQLLDMASADYIKLDPSFTDALISPEENQRLVETVQAAQKKNIKIIASQVEDANSMARLWQAGVDYVQGYFVQEPNPNADKEQVNVA